MCLEYQMLVIEVRYYITHNAVFYFQLMVIVVQFPIQLPPIDIVPRTYSFELNSSMRKECQMLVLEAYFMYIIHCCFHLQLQAIEVKIHFNYHHLTLYHLIGTLVYAF